MVSSPPPSPCCNLELQLTLNRQLYTQAFTSQWEGRGQLEVSCLLFVNFE